MYSTSGTSAGDITQPPKTSENRKASERSARPGSPQDTNKQPVAVGASLDSWNSGMTIRQRRYLLLYSTLQQRISRLLETRHIRVRRIRRVEWTDDWRCWAGRLHRERGDGVLASADPKGPDCRCELGRSSPL